MRDPFRNQVLGEFNGCVQMTLNEFRKRFPGFMLPWDPNSKMWEQLVHHGVKRWRHPHGRPCVLISDMKYLEKQHAIELLRLLDQPLDAVQEFKDYLESRIGGALRSYVGTRFDDRVRQNAMAGIQTVLAGMQNRGEIEDFHVVETAHDCAAGTVQLNVRVRVLDDPPIYGMSVSLDVARGARWSNTDEDK